MPSLTAVSSCIIMSIYLSSIVILVIDAGCVNRPCSGSYCDKVCEKPPQQGNKVPLEHCPTYPVDGRVIYRCDHGYQRRMGFSFCQKDGQWSVPNFDCTLKQHLPIPVKSNQKYQEESNANSTRDGFFNITTESIMGRSMRK